jgi:hypothetical protein
MMTAAAELAGKRKKWPPPADAEHAQRVGKLVDALRPSLPPEIVARLDDGSVAVGEFGEAHPDVATWPLGHQQYVVGFSTGMFRFIDCVASAIGRIFVDGASPTADPAFDAAVADLRDALTVFRESRAGGYGGRACRARVRQPAAFRRPLQRRVRVDGHAARDAQCRPRHAARRSTKGR